MPLPLVRLILVSLVVVSASVAAPSAAFALKPAERKAANIKAVEGVSTATGAFVEIRFRGQMEERLGRKGLRNAFVKIRLKPASGRATVITEQGPTDEPEKRRRGTRGFSEILRDGRTMFVVVKALPAPVRRVVVTTSDGRKKLAKKSARLPVAATEAELEFVLGLTDAALTEVLDDLSDAEYATYDLKARIAKTKKALRRASRPARKAKLRKRLAKQRRKLAKLNERRTSLGARKKILEGWLGILERAYRDAAVRDCNDGVDNDGDSFADFGTEPGADPGCVMRVDADEKDVVMPLTCPGPGATNTTSGTIAISQSNVLERFVVELVALKPTGERQPVLDATVNRPSDGPYTWSDTLCGGGIELSYAYRVYSDGTPFGLPDPPAGHYALTVVIAARSASGTTNPGGQDVSMRLAAGTTR